MKKFSVASVVGVLGSAGLLSLLAIGVCSPLLPASEAHAATGLNLVSTGGSSGSPEVTVTIPAEYKTLTLNLDASSSSSASGKVTGKVEVRTNNAGAYSVYAQAVDSNKMVAATNGNSAVINPVTGSKALSNLQNEWGYGVATDVSGNGVSTFKALTTERQNLKEVSNVSTANKDSDIYLTFGAGVTSALTPDTYGVSVMITAVAQPAPAAPSTMQDFALNNTCSSWNVHDTAMLTDERDGKAYWVTKLADGKCWMSQNLSTDIVASGSTAYAKGASGNTAMSSSNSDFTGSVWTVAPTTTTENTPTNVNSNSQTGTASWNLGQYVVINPTGTTACSNNTTGMSACTALFTNVASGYTASPDPNFAKSTSYTGTDGSTCTKTAGATVAGSTAACKMYDAHYLVGNYYQWNTATAGTGNSITSGTAASSICPKGWKLPLSNGTGEGTFGNVLGLYGVSSSVSGTGSTTNNATNGGSYNIAEAPLWFFRSGVVSSGQLYYAGGNGGYWSATPYSTSTRAYYLAFSTSVYPSYNDGRYVGFSVRCLIR